MPDFPSFRGRYKRVNEDTAEIGFGYERFIVKAYGLENLLFCLGDLQESIGYAINDVKKEIERRENNG